ncbi:MAG: class I adenylate-forming enzyme family protein, partial [Actinomycetes bacterium]
QIRGESVVSEYWTPGGTAEARPARGADGWLDTGDLGRMDGEGFVYLAGRLDDVINRGGEKVLPREVEETLLRDPEVSAAAVVGRPHPTVGEEPVAFVLSASGAGDAEALRQRLDARCRSELSRFKRPAEILVAETLPAGPTGKIKHGELRRAMAGGALPSDAAGSGARR